MATRKQEIVARLQRLQTTRKKWLDGKRRAEAGEKVQDRYESMQRFETAHREFTMHAEKDLEYLLWASNVMKSCEKEL